MRRIVGLLVVLSVFSLSTLSPVRAQQAINWTDLNEFRSAMKPNFVNDVNTFGDANRYVITAALTLDEDAYINGSEEVRYTNRTGQALNTIVFRLYPNMDAMGGLMEVSSVTANGAQIEPSLDGSVMGIPLAAPLAAGESIVMSMDFKVTMRAEVDASYGRFGYKHGIVSGANWYPTLSVFNVGKGWWQDDAPVEGDPAYTETGLYDVQLTVPEGFHAAMSGVLLNIQQNTDGTTTYHDVTGPMRDHIFLASARYDHITQQVDGTTLNVFYYKDADSAATQNVLKYAALSLRTYNRTYGEYPFAEFDVVENPTPTGVEYPGLVEVAEREWTDQSVYLEVIVCHETAHQWFYSLVGNDQVNHPWLDESLASYSEFVYWRVAHPNRADQYINNKRTALNNYLATGNTDQPLDLPVANYTPTAYGAIVYTKGPLFFVELEKVLGREGVYNALHEYFSRERYRVSSSVEMLSAFEAASGKDLNAIFHKWVGAFTDMQVF